MSYKISGLWNIRKNSSPLALTTMTLGTWLLGLFGPSLNGIIIALHNEDNSPVLSGWTGTGGLNNFGTRFEKIAGIGTVTISDLGTNSGSTRGYQIVPTTEEFNLADTYGWQYTTRIMVTEKSNSLGASVYTEFATGFRRWGLSFGSNSIGDPLVQPTGESTTTISGARRTFNDYVVRKAAGSATPEFLVNGEVVDGNFTGETRVIPLRRFVWGSYSSADDGEGSYQRVMLEIFPPLDDYFIEHYLLDGNANEALSSTTNTAFGVTPVADRNGNNSGALFFDSEDDRVLLDNSSFEVENRFTITAWVRPDDAVPGQLRRILSKWDGSFAGFEKGAIVLETYTDRIHQDLRARFTIYKENEQAVTITSKQVLTPGVWYHLATRIINGHMELFVNGESAGRAAMEASTIEPTAFPWGVGCDGGGETTSDDNFRGAIDDLRFYNQALSDSEIVDIYEVDTFQVASTSVEPGETGVPVDNDIAIKFPGPLNPNSAIAQNVSVMGSLSGEISATISAAFDTLAINPNTPFRTGEIIEVSLSQGIQSVDGQSLVPYSFQFETELSEIESLYIRDTRPRTGSLAGVYVDTAVGSFQQEAKTLSIQTTRPLNLHLRYNSLLDRQMGAFGYGWTHPYESRLIFKENGDITVYYDLSRCNTFSQDGSPTVYRSSEESAQFDRLQKGSTFSPFNSSDHWILTRKNGETLVFDPMGRLVGRGNRILQYLEVEWEDSLMRAIADPASDRKIIFNYDWQTGLVSSVNDLQKTGQNPYRHVFFEYDEYHRLTTIHEPVVANERQYGDFFSPMAIPDNDPDGLVHEILVDSEDTVGIVSLVLARLTHARHQDLQVFLKSPTGKELTLFDREVGSGPLSLDEERLFAFNGENPSGLWTITIKDLQSGEFGTLDRWEMALSGPSNPIHFTYPDVSVTASGNSQILGSFDAKGEQIFTVGYDNERRVINQDDGRDNNLLAQFSYNFNDPTNRTTVYTDRVGQDWTTVHDAALRLISATTPLGAETRWKFTDRGLVESVTNTLGQKNSFTWDNNGFLESATDSAGQTTDYSHNIYGAVNFITDSIGQQTEFRYNSSSRTLRQVTDAKNGRTEKRYGSNQQLLENIIEDGGGVTYGWTGGELRSAGHNQENSNMELSYDPAGRPSVITDGDGFETKITYLPNGDIIEKENPQGGIRKTVYDHRSRIIEEIDRKGRSKFFTYDGNDNLIKVTDTDGRESFFEYDGEDRVVTETDQEGRSVSYTYDPAGRRTTITNPQDQTTTIEYDTLGNQTKITDWRGLIVQKVNYDRRNMPISITGPYGNTTTIKYDELGRQSSVSDASGRTASFEYDELDRLVRYTDPIGRVFEQEYYQDDLIRTIREPMGEETNFGYDQANRPSSISNQYYSTGPSNFNGRDLITRLTLPGLDRFTLTYDNNGRIQTVNEFLNTNFNDSVRSRFYSYDLNDNVTQVRERNGSAGGYEARATRTYDTKNRVTSYTNGEAETIGYAYDEQGSLNRVTYPDGKTVSYFYDELNRLLRVVDWADRETNYEYDALGFVEKIIFPNGTTREMSYDEAGRIQERTDYDVNQTIIVQYTYTFDDASNLLVENRGHTVPPYQPENVTMTYRNGNLLETYNGIPVSIDLRGNTNSGPLNGAAVDFKYDIRGNMTGAGTVEYFYDAEDRLAGWTQNGEETRFTTNPVAGLSQILVKTAPGNQRTRYVYGIGLIYEDTPDGLRVFHYDERGNTVAVSDASGEVSGTIAYGPYGEIYNRTGSADTIFLQNGLFGVVTGPQGLCYMRYRWYSPEIKRFLRHDAHFGNITQTGTLNRFTYAGGNPITRVDPEGELWWVAGAAIGAVLSVGVELAVDLADGGGINHSFGDYAAAALGGALTGAIATVNPAYLIAGEAAGAGATNLLAAWFNGTPVDYTSLATDVAIAAAFGKVAGGGRGGGRLIKSVADDDVLRASSKLSRGREFGTFFTPDSSQYKTIVRNAPPLNVTPFSTTVRNAAEEGASLAKDFGANVLLGASQAFLSKGLAYGIDFSIENPEIFAHSEIIMDPRYQSAESTSTAGNFGTLMEARTTPMIGRRGVYGEFNHWKVYTGHLMLAREAIPVEYSQQLNTF